MPWSLKRYYETNALHFITFSCHERKPLLIPDRRDLLLTVLEKMRIRYCFVVAGYVVMPEHVHLLVSEPEQANPSTVIQAVKLSFVRKLSSDGYPISRAYCAREVGILPAGESSHFWMRRFYDFNVWSESKMSEKLHYMHQNPVTRGLVERPEDWKWSSFRAYAFGETGPVRVNDWSSCEQKTRSKAV
ncbi:MAG TPA: transposase [Candidatus Sulfotelmatobacter sp.]|nr:transposase [Candidatus Sulfotelmatobacter sp.]